MTTPGCQTQVAPLVDTVFLITVSAPSPDPIDVTLSWGGTAVAGVDYANHAASVTVPANATTLAVPAGINASAGGKTITLTVTAGAGYSVGTPVTATATVALPIFPAICIAPGPQPTPIPASPNFTG
jgi:hypothetical protein